MYLRKFKERSYICLQNQHMELVAKPIPMERSAQGLLGTKFLQMVQKRGITMIYLLRAERSATFAIGKQDEG